MSPVLYRLYTFKKPEEPQKYKWERIKSKIKKPLVFFWMPGEPKFFFKFSIFFIFTLFPSRILQQNYFSFLDTETFLFPFWWSRLQHLALGASCLPPIIFWRHRKGKKRESISRQKKNIFFIFLTDYHLMFLSAPYGAQYLHPARYIQSNQPTNQFTSGFVGPFDPLDFVPISS